MSAPRERMLAYLYGELPDDERVAFEAELQASEADRRELAELQATLRLIRAGLDADPPVPARVRANVLAAAHAQLSAAGSVGSADSPLSAAGVGEQRVTTGASSLEASRAAASAPATGTRPASFWRWLRGALIVPSLAMAGAAALLVFSRREPVTTSITPESDLRPELTPAAPELQPTAAEPQGAEPAATSAREAAPQLSSPPQPSPRAERFAQPPPGWKRSAPAREPAVQAPSSSGARVPFADEGSSRAQYEAARGSAEQGAAKAAANHAVSERATAAEAPPAPQARARASATPKAEAEPSAPASALGAPQPAATAASAPQLDATALEKRAHEHEAAGRWAPASADYRELLARFARNPRASLWQKRLAIVTRALAGQPPTAAETDLEHP